MAGTSLCELKSNDIATFGKFIAGPLLIVPKLSRAPVTQKKFDEVRDENFSKITRSNAGSGAFAPSGNLTSIR